MTVHIVQILDFFSNHQQQVPLSVRIHGQGQNVVVIVSTTTTTFHQLAIADVQGPNPLCTPSSAVSMRPHGILGQLRVDRPSIVVEGWMNQDWKRELEVLFGHVSLVELDQYTELVCNGQDSGVGHGDGLLDQIGLWDLEAGVGLEVLPRIGWGGRCTLVGCCCADDGSIGFDACLWNKSIQISKIGKRACGG